MTKKIRNLATRANGLKFRIVSSIRHSSLVVRVSVLMLSTVALASAQRQAQQQPPPLKPAEAENEARALVASMLSQKPAQTNTGLLKIRDAKREQREIPMRFEISSTAT